MRTHSDDVGTAGLAVEALAPEDAFALLGNEIRMGVLEALWRALPDRVSFSDLRETVGVRDSGQFNYHLGRLTDRFVHRNEDGYTLRPAGTLVMGAVVSGSYTHTGRADPIRLPDPCYLCGGPLVLTYEDERATIACEDCAELVTGATVPPGVLADYDTDDLPGVVAAFVRTLVRHAQAGFCPTCHGRMEGRLQLVDATDTHSADADTADPTVRVSYDCARCPERVQASVATAIMETTPVVAFHDDHGIDVTREPTWRLDWLHDDALDVVSTDPLCVHRTITLGDDRLTVVVDADLAVEPIPTDDPVLVDADRDAVPQELRGSRPDEPV
ncbi:DUF7351 domain-containing protein [Salinirubrum litoreum]|uniref:ArsR family transcriptional regulator n=1 Tax=Salinirubrum litoreum TaxID=1126234 RepID=A0ABD5RED4_9EURY|nr:ArsR family transcriptional regulator [Salinirubrum litoreum]